MIRPEDDRIVNLISIGQQGVGKTVFLASAYRELDNLHDLVASDRSEQLQVLDDLKRGQYPPPTQTSTEFDFHLKPTGSPDQIHWWDFPGQSIQMGNPDWQQAILGSHGGCLLLNGVSLMHEPDYLQSLEELIQQVLTIGFLANQHGLNYPFALVITQCDRLEPHFEPAIEPKLQPLVSRLADVIHFKTFFCAVPLDRSPSHHYSAAMPLLWLSQSIQSPSQPISLGDQLRQSLAHGQKLWSSGRRESPTVRRYMSILALANVSFQALSALKKRVEADPHNLQEQFTLARFYESQGQKPTAESIYDRILAQQNDHLKALMSKALLRSEQGDINTARKLLRQAQRVAPNDDWKAKIEAIAGVVSQPPQIGGNSDT